MRLFLQFSLTLVAAFFMELLLLPYWGVLPVAFFMALVLAKKGEIAFLGGFLSIGILWVGYTLYRLQDGGFVLAQRLSETLLGTLTDNPAPYMLFLLMLLLGGLLGGFSALSGFLLQRVFGK